MERGEAGSCVIANAYTIPLNVALSGFGMFSLPTSCVCVFVPRSFRLIESCIDSTVIHAFRPSLCRGTKYGDSNVFMNSLKWMKIESDNIIHSLAVE